MRYHRLIRAAVALAVFAAGFFAVFQTWKIFRLRSSSAAVLPPNNSPDNTAPIVLTERVELSPMEMDAGSPHPWMTMTLSPPAAVGSELNRHFKPSRVWASTIDWAPFSDFTIQCDISPRPQAHGAEWGGLGNSRASAWWDGKVSGFEIDTSKSKDIFDGNLLRDTCIITVLDQSTDKRYRVTAACDIELMGSAGQVRAVAASVTWRGPVLLPSEQKSSSKTDTHEKSSH